MSKPKVSASACLYDEKVLPISGKMQPPSEFYFLCKRQKVGIDRPHVHLFAGTCGAYGEGRNRTGYKDVWLPSDRVLPHGRRASAAQGYEGDVTSFPIIQGLAFDPHPLTRWRLPAAHPICYVFIIQVNGP